jgi:hypothetical protein
MEHSRHSNGYTNCRGISPSIGHVVSFVGFAHHGALIEVRELKSFEKKTHWGKRKLARDR